ncbi:MAG: S24 family peptidase [Chloroflexi bacterium]|nr:S24 family peptidase [Chloroflexota bacterium]
MGYLHRFRREVSRALAGRSEVSVAKEANLPRLAIRQALNKHEPKLSRAAAIAGAVGLEVYIGPPRGKTDDVIEMPRDLRASLEQLNAACDEAKGAIGKAQSVIDGVRDGEALSGSHEDSGSIVVRELRTAAGGGAFDLDESVSGRVYFKASWLRKHQLDPDQCCIMGVTGESMEPTLSDGCAILLDQRRRKLRPNSIFVVRGPDGLIVKRAMKSDTGEWVLASDNEYWPSIPWPDGAEIVGQVIWTAHELL